MRIAAHRCTYVKAGALYDVDDVDDVASWACETSLADETGMLAQQED
jgi:hypothetical protein